MDPPARWTAAEISGRELIDAVRRVNRILRSRFEQALLEYGVSYARYEILCMLERDPALHAAEIARRLRISRQAVGKLLDKLGAHGFVDLLPRDRGVVGALITDRGRRRLSTCRGSLGRIERSLETLPVEQREALLDGLGALERALRPPPPRWWEL